jgi:putative NIF3 family GTP cyclohydrolase 1 type 2
MSFGKETHVLVVDDSLNIRRIVVDSLQRMGFTKITTAEDAIEALGKLKFFVQTPNAVGLVLSDLNMPGPSGLDFLKQVKLRMNTGAIRYTKPHRDTVRRIAVCGGSGSFLLDQAVRKGADVLITSDFKYHQFFDADNRIIIADIGHYESEQFTMNLLDDWFRQKFPNFATHSTEIVTNPVLYL